MDPIAQHKQMTDGRAGDMKALRDAQMGRGPEPPEIDFTRPMDEQIPDCPNCGQKHYGERGCPHAIRERTGPFAPG